MDIKMYDVHQQLLDACNLMIIFDVLNTYVIYYNDNIAVVRYKRHFNKYVECVPSIKSVVYKKCTV